MADILISQLPAGTPLLTDLLILANPTTGIAKKSTVTTFKTSLQFALSDLIDVSVNPNPLTNDILYYDSGDWKNGVLKTINGNSLFGAGNIVINAITSLNGLNSTTQTFATSSTGTDFTITSATSTHTFNLPSASAANRGLLTAANWTTFNNKQDALVSGTNIKTINGTTILGSGNLAINSITSLNGLTAGTQLFAVASTGTDFTITSTTDTHTFAIPTASASARGLLSSANWTTFNNKIGGTGTTNYLPKFTAASTIGNSVIYETVSGNIGIGTTLDLYKLDVAGTGRFVSQSLTGSPLFIGNAEFQWNFNTSIFKAILSLGYGANNILNIGYDAPDGLIRIYNAGNIQFATNYFSLGGDANNPISSARMNVESTTQGVLIPRMTTAQINAIASPATGLNVYNTTLQQPCFYDGSGWRRVSHTNM
jgi:hypothetical protein